MALQLSLQFPPTASLPRTSSYQQIKSTPIFAQPKMIKRSTINRITRRKTTQFTVRATTAEEEEEEEEEEGEDNPQANSNNKVSKTQSVSTQQSPPSEPQPQPASSATRDPSELGSEIRKAMRERDGGGGGGGEDFWGGVREEIREIEWPAFGKVLGTTWVVLGVIAGSSVVLLTVNAVLAELSDRIFAGKGIQDFFG